MPEQIIEQYPHAPSALSFMARAVRRTQPLPADGRFPRIALRWHGWSINAAQRQAFHMATGLEAEKSASILLPHVFGFRLQMALLTHPAYPLPIWTVLQIRNRLVRHQSFDLGMSANMETQVGGHRLVDKGIEVDLVSRLTRGADCLWESRVTFFHRGRFAGPASPAAKNPSPDLDRSAVTDTFRLPDGGGWRFGKLTGDYNGIHSWNWYARRFGFRAAFLHPQRAAGMCLARLPEPNGEAQTLELWIKGPLFYGAKVQLRSLAGTDGLRFGLSLEGDSRAALVGRWQSGAPAAGETGT